MCLRVTCQHQGIQVIPDRVLFSILRRTPRDNGNIMYFTVDDDPVFRYHPFFADFGPPSLPQLIQFAHMVNSLLEKFPNKVLHFYTSPEPTVTPNSVLMIAFFRMFKLQLTAIEAFKPFVPIKNMLRPFRDVLNAPTVFDLTVLDCLKGIYRAANERWFDIAHFNAELWEEMGKMENGDMTWIIPGKALAFATPYSRPTLQNGYRVATPADVIPHMKELGVTHVIRLNKQFYDASEFRDAGLKFTEMFFDDGSVPSKSIVRQFLEICESDDVVAVHCKAGLGRTGTLIGCYMIKDYNFDAAEAIGWLRVCRPGSVMGPQQLFLVAFDIRVHNKLQPHEPLHDMTHATSASLHPRTSRTKFRPMQGVPLPEEDEDDYRPLSARRYVPKTTPRPFKPRIDKFATMRTLPIKSLHPHFDTLPEKAARYL